MENYGGSLFYFSRWLWEAESPFQGRKVSRTKKAKIFSIELEINEIAIKILSGTMNINFNKSHLSKFYSIN